MFLLGDFNVNVLSYNSNNFKDLLERQGFSNLINGPTNFTTQPGTCIDLIITNNTQLVETTNILTPVCSSHSPICMETKYFTHKEYAYKRTVRQYNQCNYDELNPELQSINWDTCICCRQQRRSLH